MKTYKIKSNEALHDRWLRAVSQTNTRIYPMDVIKNDLELTSSDLNEWYMRTKEDIEEVRHEFGKIIDELMALRDETVKYIKSCNT